VRAPGFLASGPQFRAWTTIVSTCLRPLAEPGQANQIFRTAYDSRFRVRSEPRMPATLVRPR
jgi:hypothetical protein